MGIFTNAFKNIVLISNFNVTDCTFSACLLALYIQYVFLITGTQNFTTANPTSATSLQI